ncbi:thioesterase II family protein [Pseudonocardia sp. ICBG1293]|uniref:thioesterase II family protein n=1 Tax=Pseudonocardia sp. ICBG1293 TaxID=2844382 RepID=UPI001CCBE97A|nr:alpha/beta fold hydrolase [Pseudonocardia sp. ICBG1293]
MTAASAGSWLRPPEAGTDTGRLPNLVCLPWAGGSAASFRRWPGGLAGHAVVHRVQYPGRESRFGEPPLTDPAAMAEEIAAACAPLTAAPTVLFGHSMGAALAFEAALRLEERGCPPALVVVSGHPAPGRYRSRGVAASDDAALLDELDRLAGGPSILRTVPELRELLLPVVRADFALIESYAGASPPRTAVPLAVFHGADDPDVDADGAAAWAGFTAGGRLAELRTFPGAHFYLDDDEAGVWSALTGLLRRHHRTAPHPIA